MENNNNRFIGKSIKETVELVRGENSFIKEFAVATNKGSDIIEKVSIGPYLGITGADGMDEYIIETNAKQEKFSIHNILGQEERKNKWKKTEKGYHKILSREWVGIGSYEFGQETTSPTIERDI